MSRKFVTVADYRRRAEARLPRILFDWIDGGAGDEKGLLENRSVYDDFRFLPRYLLDVRGLSPARRLFGREMAFPFGISATGYSGLFRPGADLMLAGAAQEAGVPFMLSGTSCSSIEDAARVAPDALWYQLYVAGEIDITRDLIRRADAAGCHALVVTVDIPVEAPRERDIRNGFAFPPKFSPQVVLDGMMHPAWSLRYLMSGGMPMMDNWKPYAPEGSTAVQVAQFANANAYCVQTWEHLEMFRELWPRKLIVKGVMHPADAKRAVAMGVDGIIVSNHGGRQFDRSVVAPLLIPGLRRVLGPDVPIMLDGGIRRGADILMAMCLGADFVLGGRATLFGAVVNAKAGARDVLRILRTELETLMGQVGCLSLDDPDIADFMVRPDGTPALEGMVRWPDLEAAERPEHIKKHGALA